MSVILTIRNVLTKDECQQIIDFSEKAGYHQAQVNTLEGKKTNKERRNNSRFEFKNPQLADQIWKAIEPQIPKFSGFQTTGLATKFKIYRYHPWERFSWHKDGVVSKGFYELSKLTLLVYLSDDFLGGRTEFDLKNWKVKPVIGSALVFTHSLLHQGNEIERGVKYVLRNDVFYKRGGIFGR